MGFSPLDDELALLPGRYTPRIHEAMVRLGAWMPFAEAAAIVDHLLGVQVTADTVRRHTEAAGDAYVTLQTAAVEGILQTPAVAPPSTERLVVSADGAMVPLTHGVWAEAKTLAIGTVAADGTARELSYFSRLCDADRFTHQATVETVARGVCGALQVAAVVDGAEWLQGLLDVQCPTAVRILDFAHAAQRVSQIGQALCGHDSAAAQRWLAQALHTLKQEGAATLVAQIATTVKPDPALAAAVAEDVGYLAKRVAHMDYPTYVAVGWPIGSGIVESANKLVVEARLKGAGMHWARDNVDGMLALRNIVCSDRWAAAWPEITAQVRQQAQAARTTRQQQRAARRAPRAPGGGGAATAVEGGAMPPVPVAVLRAAAAEPPHPHPWRRAWSPRWQAQEADMRQAARL